MNGSEGEVEGSSVSGLGSFCAAVPLEGSCPAPSVPKEHQSPNHFFSPAPNQENIWDWEQVMLSAWM